MAKAAPDTSLSGLSQIVDLARSRLLDELTGAELVVFIRILAAAEDQDTPKVKLHNVDLHRNRAGRTAAAALRVLQGRGLIKISKRGAERVIEVR
jgi:hypothetical protein